MERVSPLNVLQRYSRYMHYICCVRCVCFCKRHSGNATTSTTQGEPSAMGHLPTVAGDAGRTRVSALVIGLHHLGLHHLGLFGLAGQTWTSVIHPLAYTVT